MRKLPVALALAVTLVAPTAFAASVSTTTPAAGASTTITLSTSDQSKLKDWITMQKTASIAAPAGLTVAVGSMVPTTVMLQNRGRGTILRQKRKLLSKLNY
jgi:hypothetical protein